MQKSSAVSPAEAGGEARSGAEVSATSDSLSEPGASSVGSARSRAGFEASILAALALLSFLPYVTSLGFYSDDWSLLAYSRAVDDQSMMDLVRALGAENRMRPMADASRAILLRSFGTTPLGYHLVNSSLLLCAVALFWRVLVAARMSREIALASALVFSVLPHYSTLRFWFSSSVALLSLAAFLGSLLLDLRAVHRYGRERAALRGGSIALMIVSLLSYEAVLPLFAATALLISWISPAGRPLWRKRVLWGNLITLSAISLFKASIPDRLGSFGEDRLGLLRWVLQALVDPNYGPGSSGLNARAAVNMSFGTYGVELPANAWTLATAHGDRAVWTVALVCGLAAVVGLWRLSPRQRESTERSGLPVTRIGVAVFLAGYAIFLTNGNIQLTPTGTGNRTAVAAALGVALIVTGSLHWISSRLVRHAGHPLFALLIGAFVFHAYLITGTLSVFWKEAYRMETEILHRIRTDVPQLPPGSTLLLDGTCPYHGPAPIFEASWDLEGAIRLLYGDPSLRADIVNPTLRVDDDGIHTAEHDWPSHYPFGKIMVYHFALRRSSVLADRTAAEHYFREIDPDLSNGCPPGFGGWGVQLI